MENRIEINGVWYVREDSIKPKFDIIEDLTHSEHYVFESDDYSFDVVRIYRNDNDFYSGFEIRFTDKKDNREDIWDLESFFNGVLDGKPDSIELAKEDLNNEGFQHLIDILSFLRNQGWC